MAGDDKQARFSRRLPHFVLKPEVKTRSPKPKKKKKEGAKPHFPASSNLPYPELEGQAKDVYSKALVHTRIMDSPKMHFVVEFSDNLTWKPVRDCLEKLGLSVVDYVKDNIVRVSLTKEKYQNFLIGLEDKDTRKFIGRIREIGVFEKIDESFFEEIKRKPEASNLVSLEFSNIMGLENADFLENSVHKWLENQKFGTIARSFLSDNLLLLSGVLINKSIEMLAYELDQLSSVAKIPQMDMEETYNDPIALNSVVGIGEETDTVNNPLNSIMIVDSGINREHAMLQNYIDGTFDYSSRSNDPCFDVMGHGSLVAGLAIYGNDLRRPCSATARVIMVKNFDNKGHVINNDAIQVISETINNFRFRSRVLNLSFSAVLPNQSLTKALDQIIFLSDCITVVSAGNINGDTIRSYLDSGVGYPDYLENHVMFFPADCRNALTVGSCTVSPSSIVPSNCPSPFTKSTFSEDFVKPETVAIGGNLDIEIEPDGRKVKAKPGLGVLTTSNIASERIEKVGTSFSCPIVSNIAASVVQTRIDMSTFLAKALIISSCNQMKDPQSNDIFSESVQGFGKVDKPTAVNSQDWRVCYLLQGQFDSTKPDAYHRYLFLFPQEADFLDITTVCGKLITCNSQENQEYIRMFFKRPGLRSGSSLKKGERIGERKCICSYREKISIKRGSVGVWRVDVTGHFSPLKIPQKLKYGIVIAVSSTKKADVYSSAEQWLETQQERILVPAIPPSPRV